MASAGYTSNTLSSYLILANGRLQHVMAKVVDLIAAWQAKEPRVSAEKVLHTGEDK